MLGGPGATRGTARSRFAQPFFFAPQRRRRRLKGLDDVGFDLLRCMLAYNPLERCTAAQALQHPWFASEPAMCAPGDVRQVATGMGLSSKDKTGMRDLMAWHQGRRFKTSESAAHYSSRHTGDGRTDRGGFEYAGRVVASGVIVVMVLCVVGERLR